MVSRAEFYRLFPSLYHRTDVR